MKFALRYFNSNGIDLTQRARSGHFLNRAEIDAFYTACKFKAGNELSNVVSIHRYSDKSIQNAIHAGRVSEGKVKALTAKGRLYRLLDYLEFLYTSIHADHIVPDLVKQKYEFSLKHLKGKLRTLKDFNTECVAHGESLLPADKFLRLLEVIKPDSNDNPFKSSRLRNYLVVSLFIQTGIRKGALAKLKIGDCKFWGTFDEISIVKRPDDVADPRRFRPSQKTQPHRSFVPKELMQELKNYIDTVRCRYPASVDHEMIFVAEKDSRGTAGDPLSLSSIDKIFEKLSEAISFDVHPHLLRHKWNELFTDFAESGGMSIDQQDKLRKYVMGWSRDSQMGALYNEFKIFEQAKAYQQERQDSMTEGDA
ncbi:MAG: tyrosine-type recombinase/integrase [Methyloprofundus sp.]|nr:tyrosine-type recombinase/integrase [Methyloprofundus sp.]